MVIHIKENIALKVKNTNWDTFGNFVISTKDLFDNILNIKNKSGSQTPFPKMKITDDMKQTLFFILETGSIDYDLVRELKGEELNIFNKLMEKSKLKYLLKYDLGKAKHTIKYLKERFQILQGEIQAGNNNGEILSDIKDTINELCEKDVIKPDVKKDLLNELEY